MRTRWTVTYLIHRGEVAIFLVVVFAVAVAAINVVSHFLALGYDDCVARLAEADCGGVLRAVERLRADDSAWLLGIGATLFPAAMGLVLGVPVVAREVEARTASLAWSFARTRTQWFRQRVVPMLALLLTGLGVLAILSVVLRDVANPAGAHPRMDQIGSQGTSLLGRGLLGFGVALLVGAVLGRTLGAVLVSVVLCGFLILVGLAGVTGVVAQRVAEWDPVTEDDDGSDTLLSFREGFTVDGGHRMSFDQVVEFFEREYPNKDWDTWEPKHVQRWELRVRADQFPLLDAADTAGSLAIGGSAMLLTIPVVNRRRPT
jgi:hypothetical protein